MSNGGEAAVESPSSEGGIRREPSGSMAFCPKSD
jgi:hypothetical protein